MNENNIADNLGDDMKLWGHFKEWILKVTRIKVSSSKLWGENTSTLDFD